MAISVCLYVSVVTYLQISNINVEEFVVVVVVVVVGCKLANFSCK